MDEVDSEEKEVLQEALPVKEVLPVKEDVIAIAVKEVLQEVPQEVLDEELPAELKFYSILSHYETLLSSISIQTLMY